MRGHETHRILMTIRLAGVPMALGCGELVLSSATRQSDDLNATLHKAWLNAFLFSTSIDSCFFKGQCVTVS